MITPSARELLQAESRRDLQRARLVEAVAKLAHALDTGTCEPIVAELRIVAGLCEGLGLTVEAERVRRWIGDPS